MLADRYLRKRYEEGYKVGYKKGWKEGYEQGRKEGRRIYMAKFDAWNERRLRARAKGEPFNEPMPDVGDDGGDA